MPLRVTNCAELLMVGVGGLIELITGRVSVVKLEGVGQLPVPLLLFP